MVGAMLKLLLVFVANIFLPIKSDGFRWQGRQQVGMVLLSLCDFSVNICVGGAFVLPNNEAPAFRVFFRDSCFIKQGIC